MRLAILGGTFNPVHLGHLFLAEEVQARLAYRTVVFVPANVPVHKTVEIEVGAWHRLRMLRLAVTAYRRFLVDDCEVRRGGESFSIDTVREVIRRYRPDGKPGLIIGEDLADGFDTWKDAADLARITDLIVARRESASRQLLGFPCTYLGNMALPISSSEIRERLASGLPVRSLVPERVLRYIHRHGLYS